MNINHENSSAQAGRRNPLLSVWRFYVDGFKSMTTGRWLWAMILVKLFILFFVFKLFFFPDLLERDYPDDSSRAKAVRSSLLDPARSGQNYD